MTDLPRSFLSVRWLSSEVEAGFRSVSCTADFDAQCRSSIEIYIQSLGWSISRERTSPFSGGIRTTTGCRQCARFWARSDMTAPPPTDNRGHCRASPESPIAVTCEKRQARRAPGRIWKKKWDVLQMCYVLEKESGCIKFRLSFVICVW